MVYVLGELILKYKLKLKFAFIKNIYSESTFHLLREEREMQMCWREGSGGWSPAMFTWGILVSLLALVLVRAAGLGGYGADWSAPSPASRCSHFLKAGKPQWPRSSFKEMFSHPLSKWVFDFSVCYFVSLKSLLSVSTKNHLEFPQVCLAFIS